MFSINLKKGLTFVCLFFLSLQSAAQLFPGKMTGYKFSQCGEVGCFIFKGQTGFVSKINSLFSAENTQLELISKDLKSSTYFNCDEFNFDIQINVMTCIRSSGSNSFEFNVKTNNISYFKNP